MLRDEIGTVAARLLVDEIVDVALAVDGDGLGPVSGDCGKPHQLEQGMKPLRIRMAVFDELETVGPHWIVG